MSVAYVCDSVVSVHTYTTVMSRPMSEESATFVGGAKVDDGEKSTAVAF